LTHPGLEDLHLRLSVVRERYAIFFFIVFYSESFLLGLSSIMPAANAEKRATGNVNIAMLRVLLFLLD